MLSPQPRPCASGWRQGLGGCEQHPPEQSRCRAARGAVQGLVTGLQSRSAGKKRTDVSTEAILSRRIGSVGPEPPTQADISDEG